MAVECIVRAVHRGGMHFTGVVGNHAFEMDYPLDPGAAGEGPKPMEMLLASLASCAGGSVVALLRRGGHQFEALTVTARGQRRSEHPTIFTEIALEFAFRGTVDRAAVDRAISQAETRVCPVWTMLKSSTPISDGGPDRRGHPGRASSRRLPRLSRRRRAGAPSPTPWAPSASSSRSSPSSSDSCRSSAG